MVVQRSGGCVGPVGDRLHGEPVGAGLAQHLDRRVEEPAAAGCGFFLAGVHRIAAWHKSQHTCTIACNKTIYMHDTLHYYTCTAPRRAPAAGGRGSPARPRPANLARM